MIYFVHIIPGLLVSLASQRGMAIFFFAVILLGNFVNESSLFM